MAINGVNVGQELLNVPMGDMIRSMAVAIADAQWSLDKASMVVAELMSGHRMLRDIETGVMLDESGQPLQPGVEPHFVDSMVFFGTTTQGTGQSAKEVPAKVSMIELGFVPNFYQFVETIIEVKISITMTGSTTDTKSDTKTQSGSTTTNKANGVGYWWYNHDITTSNNAVATTAVVNASFASRYNYSVDASSWLRTKLVPIPPPAILQERIRAVVEKQRAKPK